MKAYFQKRNLVFNKPASTSRGILLNKPSWYIYLYDEDDPTFKGIGEVSIIPGLSLDDEYLIEQKLSEVCGEINAGIFNFNKRLDNFPAITFGVEMAWLDYKSRGSKILFSSDFTKGVHGIKTNGLIWMGNLEQMMDQVKVKLDQGFQCLKMKIGAIDLEQELHILRSLRRQFSSDELTLRVDANGAFNMDQAIKVLKLLSDLEVHSIEQPILACQMEEMAALCEDPPIPIALDEELIGKSSYENKRKLLEIIKPQYLVLKPSLLGGFRESTDWINLADDFGIGWWVTSALESNIGLNAIAQWTATLDSEMYQGLGLGNLYKVNIPSPLSLCGEKLFYDPDVKWNYEFVY